MAVEARRGCGFRKIGGLYLVGAGEGIPCDRLPFALKVCPVCSCGIKQSRGWTWFNAKALFGGAHKDCVHTSYVRDHCPACSGNVERAGLIWVGEKFYKTPLEFEVEASELGMSRRIAALPVDFVLGETWVLLAHPKAVMDVTNKDEPFGPGIFRVWRPTAVEKILPKSLEGSEEAANLVKRGITPVYVPDDDPDHQGKLAKETPLPLKMVGDGPEGLQGYDFNG